jgi:hypothetical protein
MIKKMLIVVIMSTLVAVSFAEETEKTESKSESKAIVGSTSDAIAEQAEYWIIRSQALTELVPFLTKIRTEARGHYRALTDYLKYIGKGQEFLHSGIKASSSPAEYAKAIGKSEEFVEKNIELPDKPMTWGQLVEWAMEFVKQEGYIPTDVESTEEIEMIKKTCEQKEKYGKKVRDELRKIAQDCMDMKAYLESIDQFEACVKWARYQKEEAAKAKTERLQQGREQRAARDRDRRETQHVWKQRQKHLGTRYYHNRPYRRVYYHW